MLAVAGLVSMALLVLGVSDAWRPLLDGVRSQPGSPSLLHAMRVALNQSALRETIRQGSEGIDRTPLVAMGPLLRLGENPRYFTDGSGKAVYLTGSHTWSNFQNNGGSYPPPAFDYAAYLDFLQSQRHNFFRLWVWEQSRWTSETSDNNYWFLPTTPYARTGPGNALDGKAKFDLSRLRDAYFTRLRERVVQARDRGIYVSVMLFNGWSVSNKAGQGNPWMGHPFNRANNINGVDGDLDGDGYGLEAHELADARILGYQKAYVKRVLKTLNDLDNVLYEISNESHGNSIPWQTYMVKFIKKVESTLPKRHPVGMTACWPGGDDEALFEGPADWVSPSGFQYKDSPPSNTRGKVVILDTDHIWGIGGDAPWVWKSFMRGLKPIFMDGYDGEGYGVGGAGFDFDDARWVGIRQAMGYTRRFSGRVDLASMEPCTGNAATDAASTGYCLANDSEYLVYLPGGGKVSVDLSRTADRLTVEWFNAATGQKKTAGEVDGGGKRVLTSPYGSTHAVLFLHPPR